MDAKHSPLPWILSGNAAWSDACKDRGSVFECRLRTGTHVPAEQNKTNAAYIVKAVNAHDAMADILRSFVEAYERDQSWPSSVQVDKARAALADLESKP